MGKLKNSYITNAGKTLLFGGGNITYTKAVLYGQDISNLTVPEVKALTIIGQPLMTADVGVTGKTTDGSNSTVNVTATFSNQSLKADLPFGEIGFFAKTDKQDEALIAIVMASPDAYLSAGSPDGTSTDAITVTLAMSIGDANKVDAVVDPAGSVTPASLASAVAKASADLEEAISKKDDITDVDSKLAKKADATDVDKKIADVNQTITADKADSDNKIKANSDLIATKANSSDLDKTNAEVAKKDDTTDVDAKLAKKDDITDVNSKLAKKADQTTVDDDVKTLNSAIATKANTADMTTALADKADKTDLDATNKTVATKADQSALDTTNQTVATKANSADVYTKTDVDSKVTAINKAITDDKTDSDNKIKQNADAIATKANSSDVYTKTDIDKTIATINSTLGTKITADYSYSKAELDKKFLELGTTTGSKVDADQVADMLAGKADKTAVDADVKSLNDAIATKADKATVDSEINKIDFTPYAKTADVNSELAKKADTDTVNSQVADAKNSAKSSADALQAQITNLKNSTEPIIQGSPGDDLFAYKTTQLRYYPGNGANCKNLPPAKNTTWFTVEYKFENPNGGGIAIFRSPSNEIWTSGNNGGTYGPPFGTWKRVANSDDVSSLQTAINAKADTTTVNSQVADAKNTAKSSADNLQSQITTLDGKAVKSIEFYPNNISFANGAFGRSSELTTATPSNGKAVIDDGDDGLVNDAVNELNTMLTDLNNTRGLRTADQADANSLTDAGVYYVSSPKTNFPVSQWGTLFVANGQNATRLAQMYFPDDNSVPWYRTYDGQNKAWASWIQLASQANISNLQNQVNTKLSTTDFNSKFNISTPLYRQITADSTWQDIFGVGNPNAVLTSLRINPGGKGSLNNDFSSGIGFGGDDTKAVLSVDYGSSDARITAGNGNAPSWSESIAWKSDVSNLQSQINDKEVTGNWAIDNSNGKFVATETAKSNHNIQSFTQAGLDLLNNLQTQIASLQSTVKSQAQTIASLQATVSDQSNQIAYIKANYIEGKRFTKAQEADATTWESANPQRIAFIEDK